MMETQSREVHAGNTNELGNHANNIQIMKHELETETKNEAQTSNNFNPFEGSELDGTIKVENSNSESLVKIELVEYYDSTSTSTTEISNPNHLQTVVTLETIPKTETNILGDKACGPSSEEYEDDVGNTDPQSDCDSSSDPDAERDPFADVDCDPSFSQRQPHSHNSNNSSPKITYMLVTENGLKPLTIIRQPETLLNSELQCQLCLQNQASATKLKTHVEICAASHKHRRRFCVPCNKLLCTTQSYRKHALKMHGVKVALAFKRHWLYCQLCPSSFPGKKNFMAHLASHHGSTTTDGDGLQLKPYRCQECPSSFAYVGGLTNHVQKHKPEVFKCQESNCKAAFKQKHRLRLHLQRVHSEERPYKCQELNCGKTFKRTDGLAKHRLIHTTSTYPMFTSPL